MDVTLIVHCSVSRSRTDGHVSSVGATTPSKMPSTPPTGPVDAGTDQPSDDCYLDAPAMDWSTTSDRDGPAVDSAPSPDSGVAPDTDASAGEGGCP
jgi:hypothetical protein